MIREMIEPYVFACKKTANESGFFLDAVSAFSGGSVRTSVL